MFGSAQSGEGQSADGWQSGNALEVLLVVSLICPLPLRSIHPFVASLLLICFHGDGTTGTASGRLGKPVGP
jgi:hypothetical protein